MPLRLGGRRSDQNRSSSQFLPERKREPAGAPLPRPAQPQLRQLQPNDRGVRHDPFAAVFGKQRQRLRPVGLFVQHLNRPAPRQLLRVVDLAEMKNMLLNDPPAGDAPVFDDAEVAMPLAVLLANLAAQKHDGAASFTDRAPGKHTWSALQPFSAYPSHRAQAISIACAITRRQKSSERPRIG